MRETLEELLYKDGRFQFRRLESLMEQAVKIPGRSSNRPQGAPSMADGALVLLLSPEAFYIRSILIDEIAKGLDAVLRMAVDSVVSRAQTQAKARDHSRCSRPRPLPYQRP